MKIKENLDAINRKVTSFSFFIYICIVFKKEDKIMYRIFLIVLFTSLGFSVFSQDVIDNPRPITTAVPFLTIAPDSRAGGMGDVGVATPADINSIKYNVAKYPFAESDYGISISYTPWLRKLVGDINLLYISGYKKMGEKQSISGSLTYFALGEITTTDDQGNEMRVINPNEFAFKFGYSRLLTNHLSLGVSLGYIFSDLTQGITNSATEATAGQAFAADLGIFYNNDIDISGKDANYAIGMSISDIGNKMSYSGGVEKNFIPTTMRLGAAFTIEIDDYNSIMGSLEFSKLLVPTPPIYYVDGDVMENGDTANVGGEYIQFGKSNDVSVGSGVFQSFYDAPGMLQSDGSRSVIEEELKEVMWGVGVEYWYAKQFALRGGYFHESMMKGNRKFFAVGVGLKYNVFGLDFAYLIPSGNNSPLDNTLRFTISFDFADIAENN